MFTTLVTWWKEQMRDLVPASLRFSGHSWRRTLLIAADKLDNCTVSFSLLGRKGAVELGRHPLSGHGLRETIQRLPSSRRLVAVLRIDAGLFLERDAAVPIVAERDLKRVIGYEMDRLTPFQASEVFWTCAITKRDTERNRLHVRVAIVPRVRVQSVLDALQLVGIVPARIEADNGQSQPPAIPLIEDRAKRGWIGPRVTTCSLAACGGLAVAAVVMPFVFQAITQSALDSRIEALKPQLALAEGLRKKIANSTTMTEAATAARTQAGAPLRYVALLTDALPDDTFLTSITLRQRKLTVSGRSAAAARLIGALAANPAIRNPTFAAPVIRDETNGGEGFTIRAELGS